jgi:hypothetical protein
MVKPSPHLAALIADRLMGTENQGLIAQATRG